MTTNANENAPSLRKGFSWLWIGLAVIGLAVIGGAIALWPRGGQPAAARIAFMSDRDGNDEIYVMEADPDTGADGGNPTNLTNDPANDVNPAWSLDGQRIAFVSYRDGNLEIYVMETDPDTGADGGNPTRLTPGTPGTGVPGLTDDPAVDWYPAWSPAP